MLVRRSKLHTSTGVFSKPEITARPEKELRTSIGKKPERGCVAEQPQHAV
jgi:hypothetical protein